MNDNRYKQISWTSEFRIFLHRLFKNQEFTFKLIEKLQQHIDCIEPITYKLDREEFEVKLSWVLDGDIKKTCLAKDYYDKIDAALYDFFVEPEIQTTIHDTLWKESDPIKRHYMRMVFNDIQRQLVSCRLLYSAIVTWQNTMIIKI